MSPSLLAKEYGHPLKTGRPGFSGDGWKGLIGVPVKDNRPILRPLATRIKPEVRLVGIRGMVWGEIGA